VRELPPGGDAEFCEDLAQVPLHGAGTQEKLGADLTVGLPVPGAQGDL
jgi:hypothetical protein